MRHSPPAVVQIRRQAGRRAKDMVRLRAMCAREVAQFYRAVVRAGGGVSCENASR